MEDQILLKLDDGLEMVVTFEVEAGEEATHISPSHPATVRIIRVVLWQKNHTSFERIDMGTPRKPIMMNKPICVRSSVHVKPTRDFNHQQQTTSSKSLLNRSASND
jgi:hypothetical protein